MDGPRKFFDISKPGSTPATPSGRPVIPATKPVQADPMFAKQSTGPLPLAPTPTPTPTPPVSPTPTPSSLVTQPEVPNQIAGVNAEPVHKMSHQEAFFGHVGSHHKGRNRFLIVLLVLILAGAGIFGYLTLSKKDNKVATDAVPATTTPVAETPAVTKTSEKLFTSKLSGFSIENKYDWKVSEKDTSANYKGLTSGEKITLSTVEFAINEKQKLVFEADANLVGNDCVPKKTDKPFQKGNNCSSFTRIKADKLPESSYVKSAQNSSSADAYVSTYKYMGRDDSKPFTMVGIENIDNTTGVRDLNTAVMGYFMPYTSVDVLTEKTANVPYTIYNKIIDAKGNPTQLIDSDIAKVEEVLKTFKII